MDRLVVWELVVFRASGIAWQAIAFGPGAVPFGGQGRLGPQQPSAGRARTDARAGSRSGGQGAGQVWDNVQLVRSFVDCLLSNRVRLS